MNILIETEPPDDSAAFDARIAERRRRSFTPEDRLRVRAAVELIEAAGLTGQVNYQDVLESLELAQEMVRRLEAGGNR